MLMTMQIDDRGDVDRDGIVPVYTSGDDRCRRNFFLNISDVPVSFRRLGCIATGFITVAFHRFGMVLVAIHQLIRRPFQR